MELPVSAYIQRPVRATGSQRQSGEAANLMIRNQYRPMDIELKRVYEKPAITDGKRILVERLWPRGLTKEKAQVDVWLKDIAPSTALRKWFGHDPDKWTEFKKRYRVELMGNGEAVARLKDEVGTHKATLVYGSKDEIHNAAIVLMEFCSAH